MNRCILLLTLLATLSCAEAPALEVLGVTYQEQELLGLTPALRDALADLTAFGVAAAAGSLEGVGEPLRKAGVQRRLAELLRAQRAFDTLDIDETSLRLHYEGTPDVELTVRHLIVLSPRFESPERREEARAKAARALERILAGEAFPEVAAEVSEEPGAEGRQGLLQPGREGSWVREFWNAALALEVGGVSPVVETQYGFHVLRLEGREVLPFEEARSKVTLAVADLVGIRPAEEPPLPAPAGLRITPGAELATWLGDPAKSDVEEIATFQGGTLTLGELRDHLATQEADAYKALLDPTRTGALETEVERLVRWRSAAEEAGTRGFKVGAAYEESLRLDWTDLANGWAAVLGFRAGMGSAAVKAAALQALRTTGQNATLARVELLAHSPLLRRSWRTPPTR